MGLQDALNSGLSGLVAYGNQMSVIGNNLSNTNTIGYKGSRAIFSDMLSSEIASSGYASQVGRGVNTHVVTNLFSQGNLQSTNSATDLAIQGAGFFIAADPASQANYYTRAGSFNFDNRGYLVNPSGLRVQGYQLDTDNNAIGTIGDIQVQASSLSAALATTEIDISTNLNSDASSFAATVTGFGQTVAGLAGDVADESFDLNDVTVDLGSLGSDYNKGSAKAIAEEINNNNGEGETFEGITAYPTTTTVSLGSIVNLESQVELTGGDFVINGENIEGTISTGNAASDIVGMINEKTDTTGVIATNDNGSIVLEAEDGSNIQLERGGIDDKIFSDFDLTKTEAQTTFANVTLSSQSDITIANWSSNDPVGISFAEGSYSATDFDPNNPGETSNFATSTEIYDSKGQTHVLTTYYQKVAPNEWDYFITIPGADVGSDNDIKVVGEGHVSFNSSGALVEVNGQEVSDDQEVSINTEAIIWANGADPSVLQLIPDFTQFSSESLVYSQQQNGSGSGSLDSINVDQSGYIIGSYSNGQTQKLAQLALASFNSNNGLQKIGNSLFQETMNSGEANIGAPGEGMGSIYSNTLEGSNIDVAEQFSEMITSQRAFQANARTITTTDEMLNEVINLKR
jgi:flagellar hook protein FlgE